MIIIMTINTLFHLIFISKVSSFFIHTRYGPRKVEIISFSPYIAMVHSFISNTEGEDLISNAESKLKRSSVGSDDHGKLHEFDEKRLSEQTWLDERTSVGAKRITARLDNFLDVAATSKVHSESYQGSDTKCNIQARLFIQLELVKLRKMIVDYILSYG